MAIEGNPWTVANVVEVRCVPVTVEVVTKTGANEQMRQEIDIQIDRVRWTVAVVVCQINWLSEMNWREAGAAILKLVVPVAGLINAAVGSPNIS